MKLRLWIGSLCVPVSLFAAPAYAQDGGALFKTYCATCHEAGGNAQAPNREALSRMSPEQILQAMEKGAMKAQAAERSRAQRHVLAEYLSGRRSRASPRSFRPLDSAATAPVRFAFRSPGQAGMAGAPGSRTGASNRGTPQQ